MPHPARRAGPSRCSAARSSRPLGLIAGIWADKFDQLAAFQNFLIVPLTSSRACSTRSTASRRSGRRCRIFNPFFYMIDGFRYGFFGLSDVPPAISLAVVAASAALLALVALALLTRGWKLRH
jgi:ABC-2 type transport system permease protein